MRVVLVLLLLVLACASTPVRYLGSGAKNLVWVTASNKTVMRYGFAANLESLSVCVVSTDDLRAAISGSNILPPNVLSDSQWRSKMDISSLQSAQAEALLNAQASSVQNTGGINTPLSRQIIPFAMTSSLTCRDKHDGSPHLIQSGMYLTLEEQIFFSEGTVQHLHDQDKLSQLDAFIIGANWFADQRSFKQHLGTFHLDGHPGNLLVNRTEEGMMGIIWNDWGSTTSFMDHPEEQGARTVASIMGILKKHFALPDLLLNECMQLTMKCCDVVLAWVTTNELFADHRVTKRLVGSLLLDRVTRLEEKVTALEADNVALREQVTALEADNVAIKEDNVALRKQVTALEADNVALRANITEITIRLNQLIELNKQYLEHFRQKKGRDEL
jgi:regulator of replication initiation timing